MTSGIYGLGPTRRYVSQHDIHRFWELINAGPFDEVAGPSGREDLPHDGSKNPGFPCTHNRSSGEANSRVLEHTAKFTILKDGVLSRGFARTKVIPLNRA